MLQREETILREKKPAIERSNINHITRFTYVCNWFCALLIRTQENVQKRQNALYFFFFFNKQVSVKFGIQMQCELIVVAVVVVEAVRRHHTTASDAALFMVAVVVVWWEFVVAAHDCFIMFELEICVFLPTFLPIAFIMPFGERLSKMICTVCITCICVCVCLLCMLS